jgi:hypothetical protein
MLITVQLKFVIDLHYIVLHSILVFVKNGIIIMTPIEQNVVSNLNISARQRWVFGTF